MAHADAAALVVASAIDIGCLKASTLWRAPRGEGQVGGQSVTFALLICLALVAALLAASGWLHRKGVRAWVRALAPCLVCLAVREYFLLRLTLCCPTSFGLLYRSPALLCMAVPIYYLLSGSSYKTFDTTVAACSCFVLFIGQYDFRTHCSMACLLDVVPVSFCSSAALAYLYHRADTVDDAGSGAFPGLFAGAVFAMSQFSAANTLLLSAMLRCTSLSVIACVVVRAKRAQAQGDAIGLPEVVLSLAAGGAAVQLSDAGAGKSVFLCMCLVAVGLKSLVPSRTAGRSPLAAAGSCAVCVVVLLVMVVAPWSPDGSVQQARLPPPTASVRPHRMPQAVPVGRLVNATLIIMDSKRKPLLRSIDTLQKNYLACWPYPINVFVEGGDTDYQRSVREKTTSAVTFHDVHEAMRLPPNGITMETVRFWIEVKRYGRGHHFGYRMMCRFFAGVFARAGFLQEYDLYFRLDTDSYFTGVVRVDPLRHLVVSGCSYGFINTHRAHTDPESVTTGLYEATLEWAEEAGLPQRNISRMQHELVDRAGRYRRHLFYNNFEVGSVALMSGADYQSYFDFLDATDGFMKHRWGDAPVRTLAMHMLLSSDEMCDFERLVPYRHGRYRSDKVYRSSAHSEPRCPSRSMRKDETGKYGWPPRYSDGG